MLLFTVMFRQTAGYVRPFFETERPWVQRVVIPVLREGDEAYDKTRKEAGCSNAGGGDDRNVHAGIRDEDGVCG